MKNRTDWQRVIIPQVKELIGSYSYRPTLRQIFYRLVARFLIPNTEVAYKSLSRALTLARERGVVDPLALVDRIRESHGGDYGWEDPPGFYKRADRGIYQSVGSIYPPFVDKSTNTPGPLGRKGRSLSSSDPDS